MRGQARALGCGEGLDGVLHGAAEASGAVPEGVESPTDPPKPTLSTDLIGIRCRAESRLPYGYSLAPEVTLRTRSLLAVVAVLAALVAAGCGGASD